MKKNLNNIFNNLFYYLLFLMPVIDFITSIYTWNGKHFWVSSILKTLILVIFFLVVLKKNKDRRICWFLTGYLLIVVGAHIDKVSQIIFCLSTDSSYTKRTEQEGSNHCFHCSFVY